MHMRRLLMTPGVDKTGGNWREEDPTPPRPFPDHALIFERVFHLGVILIVCEPLTGEDDTFLKK